MPSFRHRPPPLVSAVCLALSLITPLALADAGGLICGEQVSPTVPSDLANGISDQSLAYMAHQPASMLVCSKGYLLEKCGDHETSNMVFDKCIAAGYVGAMIWKARLLEEGAGVERDLVKATELLHRAAVSGDPAYGPLAKMHYATALQLGRGVAKNEAEARQWFEAAAAEGSAEARDFLQTGYHTGSRDYSTLGAGTPTAAALAKSLPADEERLPLAAREAASAAPRAAMQSARQDVARAAPQTVAQGTPQVAATIPAQQARKLVSEASAATPAPLAPAAPQPSLALATDAADPAMAPRQPSAPPPPEAAPAGADVRGQKLERREPQPMPTPGLPPASAGLGLLLLVAFLAGMLRRRRANHTPHVALTA